MPMTLLIASNVEDRYHGFLSSIMLELAPGVYAAPRMTRGVRDRVWTVVCDWHETLQQGSIILVWPDEACPGGLGLSQIGMPRRDIVELDGILLVRRFGTTDSVSNVPDAPEVDAGDEITTPNTGE